jgi:hypothetical protein
MPSVTGSKALSLTGRLIARLVVIVTVSLACWYTWDTMLDRYDGVCVGPFCIQTDATIEGESLE